LHTSPISYLIHIAEEQKEKARHDLDLGALDAEERFHEWSTMLDALRRMRDRGFNEALESAFEFPNR